MALISRPYTYVSGNTIDPAEVTAVENTIIDEINGSLDETNFSETTQIPSDYLAAIDPSKVDDISSTALLVVSDAYPGDTASSSAATSLQAELQQLRFKARAAANHNLSATASSKTTYVNSSNVAASASWKEARTVGPNLLPNSGFEQKTSATITVAPDGWTLLGTPTSLTVNSTAASSVGVSKRCLLVACDASDEGIQYTVKGLKASTKYLVGCVFTVVSGTFTVSTTGALGAGNAYQNFSIANTTGTASPAQGIIKTDASGSDVTVRFHSGSSGTPSFRLYYVWMYEMTNLPMLEVPIIPVQVATYSTADDPLTNSGAGAWSTRSDLTLSQYIPCLGYRLTYEVTVCVRGGVVASSDRDYQFALRITSNKDGGGATTVEGPYAWKNSMQSNGEFLGTTITLRYVLDDPAPGSTYVFTTDAWTKGNANGDFDTFTFNPTVGGGGDTLATVSRARLIMDRR